MNYQIPQWQGCQISSSLVLSTTQKFDGGCSPCCPQIPGKMKSAPIANSFTAWHFGIWCKQKLGNLIDFVRGGMPFRLALCKQKSHQLLLCPLHCHMVLTQSKRKDLQSGQVSNKTDLEQCATNRERQCLQHGWSSPTRLMSRFTDLLWNLFSGC